MIAIGSKAAQFELPNQDDVNVALRDYAGKWVVLYFYPKDNTSGCTKEACEFTSNLKAFEALGAAVIGVSPDSVKSHLGFMIKHNLVHTLLSDTDKTALASYGVWQEKSMYGRKYLGVLRTTYLITPDGVVAARWDKVTVTGHAENVLKKLKELTRK
ncbi:peroxiredoxin [Campylobacterota bacterium]|nr:peroxiredoxin [Campylobacterota bacterium]